MTPYQTLAVSIRLAAIWLFLYCLSTMIGSYTTARNYNVFEALGPILIGLFVVIFICGLLWFFPLFIAKKILPITDLTVAENQLFDSWFSVGTSLIGVFVLAKAIPALTSYALRNYLAERINPESFVINPDWQLMVLFYIFQLVIGLWLFFGGKGLKKILNWARSDGNNA